MGPATATARNRTRKRRIPRLTPTAATSVPVSVIGSCLLLVFPLANAFILPFLAGDHHNNYHRLHLHFRLQSHKTRQRPSKPLFQFMDGEGLFTEPNDDNNKRDVNENDTPRPQPKTNAYRYGEAWQPVFADENEVKQTVKIPGRTRKRINDNINQFGSVDSRVPNNPRGYNQRQEQKPMKDLIGYTCRIVAPSDGKLPTKPELLPTSLFEPPLQLARKLDTLYHAVAHEETRDLLQYMMMQEEENTMHGSRAASPIESNLSGQQKERREEQQIISVLRESLEDAGFELLSQRDLDLCEALNSAYLLRLSIVEDLSNLDDSISREFYPERFKQQHQTSLAAMEAVDKDETANNYSGFNQEVDDTEPLLFDGRVLVFWRGYSREVTRGRLLLPKLDCLQANIVQRAAYFLRARLNFWEDGILAGMQAGYDTVESQIQSWALHAIESLPSKQVSDYARAKLDDKAANGLVRKEKRRKANEKVVKWKRYGGYRKKGFASPDPTDALAPFMICEVDYDETPQTDSSDNSRKNWAPWKPAAKLEAGSPPSPDSVDHDIYVSLNEGQLTCEYDNFMARSTGRSPPAAMQLLERVSISNTVDLSPTGRGNWLKAIVSKSELVEPTYEEVIVVWRPLPPKSDFKKPILRPPQVVYDFADMFDIEGLPDLPRREPEEQPPQPLEIRAFAGVPMANVPAVLPKTKLIFRPADAFVFDLVSLVSLFLVLGSQRFDSQRLDILAVVSVVLWIVRTVIRYSNKLARYDLLVKTFLTSKIIQRNSGALKYLATEAGCYRATRAALIYIWLTSPDRQVTSSDSNDRASIIREGAAGVNNLLRQDKQVRVDIDAGLRDLEDLGLVRFSVEEKRLESLGRDTSAVTEALGIAWTRVLEGGSHVANQTRQGN